MQSKGVCLLVILWHDYVVSNSKDKPMRLTSFNSKKKCFTVHKSKQKTVKWIHICLHRIVCLKKLYISQTLSLSCDSWYNNSERKVNLNSFFFPRFVCVCTTCLYCLLNETLKHIICWMRTFDVETIYNNTRVITIISNFYN